MRTNFSLSTTFKLTLNCWEFRVPRSCTFKKDSSSPFRAQANAPCNKFEGYSKQTSQRERGRGGEFERQQNEIQNAMSRLFNGSGCSLAQNVSSLSSPSYEGK